MQVQSQSADRYAEAAAAEDSADARALTDPAEERRQQHQRRRKPQRVDEGQGSAG